MTDTNDNDMTLLIMSHEYQIHHSLQLQGNLIMNIYFWFVVNKKFAHRSTRTACNHEMKCQCAVKTGSSFIHSYLLNLYLRRWGQHCLCQTMTAPDRKGERGIKGNGTTTGWRRVGILFTTQCNDMKNTPHLFAFSLQLVSCIPTYLTSGLYLYESGYQSPDSSIAVINAMAQQK